MGGSLFFAEIKAVQSKYPIFKEINCFIETGTAHGGTTLPMSAKFKTVHTIEIMETLYLETKQKAAAKGIKNIVFHLGDSEIILPELAKSVREPAVFFLDGHFCRRDSGRGSQDTPLLDELAALVNYRNYNEIIIIDDFSHFNKIRNGLDWRNITLAIVAEIMGQTLLKQYVRNDRLIVLKKKINLGG